MPFVTCQRSAAAAKGFNTCVLSSRPPTRASVSFFRSKSDNETGSARPLHVLFGSVPQPARSHYCSSQESVIETPKHTTNASQAGIDAPCECSRAAADCVASSWSQDAAPGLRCTHDVRHAWRSVLNSRRPARSTRFRNVTTPSPRQRTHRSRPTQALRLPSDRRRLGRHRVRAPRRDARC